MNGKNLDTRYQNILETGETEQGTPPQGRERRTQPRLRIESGMLPIDINPWVFAVDISVSGMSFFTEDPVPVGERFTITLGHEAFAGAEVLLCRLEEEASSYQPARYRVNCRFTDEDEGKNMLVRIKELEGVELIPDE